LLAELKPRITIKGPEGIEVQERCNNRVLVEGAGCLHNIIIGNAGCCMFEVTDNGRRLFAMMPAFVGSFFLEAGFNERLVITIDGETAAHLYIQVRRAPNDKSLTV
jgi:hypothetical protein